MILITSTGPTLLVQMHTLGVYDLYDKERKVFKLRSNLSTEDEIPEIYLYQKEETQLWYIGRAVEVADYWFQIQVRLQQSH